MSKTISLIICIILMILSAYAYLYVDHKIRTGEGQLSTGEKEYAQGEVALKKGEAELSAGEQKLSRGKQAYKATNIIPFVAVAKEVPIVNLPFKGVKKSIDSGDKRVASGQTQVNEGEKRLAAGKAQLAMAKKIRAYLGWATAFFLLLSLLILFFWRRIPRKIA